MEGEMMIIMELMATSLRKQLQTEESQGQNLQFPKVFSVCTLQVYVKFTENVTLQVSRCVNYTVN